jgi:hypothetical protein
MGGSAVLFCSCRTAPLRCRAMNEAVILAGQLLGIAFACGLNLYATVALLGLSARLGLVAELPVGMGGLETAIVIGAAAALYLIELIVDRIPFVDHAWEAAHTLVRPAAAGLLVLLAVAGQPLFVQLGAALAASVTALAAHGTKAGLRLIYSARWLDEQGRLRPRRGPGRATLSFAEDIAAVGLVVGALLYPTIAVSVLAAILLLLVLAGPRLWRAAFLGFRAVIARTRGLFGRRGWRTRNQLPRSLRNAIPEEAVGRGQPRAAPVAVTGLPRVGAYRHGFLVFTGSGPRFVYRALFRSRTALLDTVDDVRIHRGLLTDTMEVSLGRSRTATFFLLKDGPPAHAAAAEMNQRDP